MNKTMDKTMKKVWYIPVYSIMFCALAALVFYSFWSNGRILMYSGDNTTQDYVAFLYWGRYLRDVVSNLLVNHSLVIPMWDDTIGLGADIIVTLHYYIIGDPINLLAIFSSGSNSELVFCFVSLLKLYIGGLSFCIFCVYKGRNKLFSVLGAFIYIFSGYVLSFAVNHIMFLSPIVYFPLLIMGIDRLVNEKKRGMFIVFVALMGASNFYFFYMACFMVVLYYLVLYFGKYGKNLDLKHFLRLSFECLGCALIGVMIASPILVPVAYELFGNGRMSAGYHVPLTYGLSFYKEVLASFMTMGSFNVAFWTSFGFTAVGAFGIIVLFSIRRSHTAGLLKTGFIIMTLLLCIPFAGHIINGFSYACNRWMWAYSMLVSYIFVWAVPEAINRIEVGADGAGEEEPGISLKTIIFATVVVAILGLLLSKKINAFGAIAAMILLIVCLAFVIYSFSIIKREHLVGAISIALICGLLLNGVDEFSPWYSNGVLGYNEQGVASMEAHGSFASILPNGHEGNNKTAGFDNEAFEDGRISRTEHSSLKNSLNSSMLEKKHGTSVYFSIVNGNLSRFYKELGMCYPMEYRIYGADERSFVDSLLGVRYFVTGEGRPEKQPFGYDTVVANEGAYYGSYTVYETQNDLNFGFTSDQVIPRSTYEQLTDIQKQQALMQGIVAYDETFSEYGFAEPQLAFSNENKECSLEACDGATLLENGVRVYGQDAKVKIRFDGNDNCETYVKISGLNFADLSPYELNEASWDSMNKYDRNVIRRLQKSYIAADTADFVISCESGEDKISKQYQYRNPESTSYCGRHDFLYNIGYFDDAIDELTLTFKKTGLYTWDDISIECQSCDDLKGFADKLNAEHLDNVIEGVNSYSGDITISGRKMLCLQIPYSKGWKAWVDGERVNTINADTLLTGIVLEKGTHHIELKYETPLFAISIVLMLVGILATLALVIFQLRLKKNITE